MLKVKKKDDSQSTTATTNQKEFKCLFSIKNQASSISEYRTVSMRSSAEVNVQLIFMIGCFQFSKNFFLKKQAKQSNCLTAPKNRESRTIDQGGEWNKQKEKKNSRRLKAEGEDDDVYSFGPFANWVIFDLVAKYVFCLCDVFFFSIKHFKTCVLMIISLDNFFFFFFFFVFVC